MQLYEHQRRGLAETADKNKLLTNTALNNAQFRKYSTVAFGKRVIEWVI